MVCVYLILTGAALNAQQIKVTGTVTDAGDGSTLPGVSVQVKGTHHGTVTNLDGTYELNVAPDAVLVYRFIGMTTREIPVDGRNIIDVALATAATALSEVVVMGYGTERAIGSVVGSISTVNAAEIESRPMANLWDAMQGKVAGVQVYTSTGEPSASSSVRLHGVGSISASSTPLYVLDGVPIAAGNVLSINPNDIESVTFLKDASATSIYGSRAANGVMYITTKRGHRDQQATVRLNSQYGFSSLANTSYFESFMNADQLASFWLESGFRNEEQIRTLREQYPADTRWHEYFYQQNTPTYQGDISIQGGGGRTTYYVSGAYYYQDGVAARSEYERYSVRANINSHANDWLSFGTNIGLSNDNRQINPMYAGTNNSYLNYGLMELLVPFYSPYDEEGDKHDHIPGLNIINPKYREEYEPAIGNNTQLNMTGYLQLNPAEGLTIRSQGGIDAYDYRETETIRPLHMEYTGNGRLREYFSRSNSLSITNTAEYKFNTALRNDFTLLAGQEYIQNDYNNFFSQVAGISDDRLILLGAGDPDTRGIGQSKSDYAYSSFFGRIDYARDRRYYADLSLRRDESSRFGRENRSATFWSAGVMWDAAKESFVEDMEVLTSLRFKASIGTSGNSEIGNYRHLATMGTFNPYQGQSSWLIASPGNPRLTWEAQTKTTIGTDFGLWNDRIRTTMDYYIRNTESMLMAVPQPYVSGFDEIMENVGSMRNSGIDLSLSLDVVRGTDYFLTSYTNLNYNKNEITELFHGRDQWFIANTSIGYIVGEPVAFVAPIFAGIDPEDGMAMWYVPGEDRSVTRMEETTKVFVEADLEQYTGKDRYAPWSGGFGLNGGWRGITLQMDFSFSSGHYMINNDRYFSENPTVFQGFNQSKDVADYWKNPGDVTRFPRWGQQFTQFDTRLLERASFVRLKNLTLSWELPERWLAGTGTLAGMRVFASGRNLLTFTDYKGKDPEVDSNIAMARNPNTRQISFGLSVTM